jgi:hypothetical protein
MLMLITSIPSATASSIASQMSWLNAKFGLFTGGPPKPGKTS